MTTEQVVTQVIEAVVVHPGDILVVSLAVTSQSEIAQFGTDLRARLGPDVIVVVIGGAVSIDVLRPDQLTPAASSPVDAAGPPAPSLGTG